MRIKSILVAIATSMVSASAAFGLESSITARSSLSPGELWNRIGDFCGMSAWDPIVERCDLSADGRQRTIVIFRGVGRLVATLDNWDSSKRTFTWTGVSGPAPIGNYRGKVSVIADGQTSALRWDASYQAKGVSDAEAQKIIDGALYRALCVSSPLVCTGGPITPVELVSFSGSSFSSKPLTLRGYLRRPTGGDPSPAIVLLHGCDGSFASVDQNWGARIAAWGYVTLTIDSLGPRGLKNTCGGGGPPLDVHFDAYQALNFLVQQGFVEPGRVFVIGFSQGGWLSLSSVERGIVEQSSKNKFRAAAAFYPPCFAVRGPMTVPTLILIGESDDWTPAEACRKLVSGQDDLGVTRQKGDGPPMQLAVYPNAYHAFDVPNLVTPVQYFGHHLEFNKSAADQSSEALRQFLGSMLEDRP
jgi:dienelactone hydrolase